MARYLAATGTPSIFSCTNASLSIPLLFEPGDRWDYGIGIDWAGKAVEAVSGQRLGQYMQQNLLQPLGMTDTGFRIGPAQRQRLAKVHNRTPEGFVATDLELPQDPEFEMGGGGLYSTAGDYLRFTRMILNGGTLDGTRVLARETVAAMSANAMGDLVCRPLKTVAPPLSNDVDFIDGMKWGLSFLINPAAVADGPFGGIARLGRAGQLVFLDRPGKARDRRLRDAAIAVLRREGRSAVPGFRGGGLSPGLRRSCNEPEGDAMDTAIDEIADGIYRLSTYAPQVAPPAGLTYNVFLIPGDEPLLFHTGKRGMFPGLSAALARVLPLERLRWISFAHYEFDECGAMNGWLAAAPRAEIAHGQTGCRVSLNDMADRAPRALADGEVIDLGGGRRVR